MAHSWTSCLSISLNSWFLAVLILGGAVRSSAQGSSLLSWQAGSGYRRASVVPGPTGRTGFTLMPPSRTGVLFSNELAEFSAAQNRVLESGSGVALGDVDGDGRCDVYLCRLEGNNALYRNLGNWTFEDITESAGVACPRQYSTGCVLPDVDGDGDLDLLVNAVGGGTRCFLNDGRARFTEVTNSRLVRRFASMSLSLADIEGDGDLDLYVVNYSTTSYRDNPPGLKVEARLENGRVVISPPDRFIPIAPQGGAVEVIEMGERDFLYINDGQGRFLPVSWTNGTFLTAQGSPYTAPPRGWGLSVMFRDLNRDRHPDLYVCNDFFYFGDDIWLNVNGGQFREPAPTAFRHVSLSSMAIDVADINRDGFDDLFVVDMVSRMHSWRHRQRPDLMGGRLKLPTHDPAFRPEAPHNTLFLNRGDHTWVDIAQLAGVDATEWSWGTVFLDVDLDGWEDLLVVNGNDHDVQDADVLRELAQLRDAPTPQSRLRHLSRFGRLNVRNLAFRNEGDLRFSDQSRAWGFDLDGITHGMALADLDNDGDLDVVCNNLHSAASFFRNDSIAPRVAVRLKGMGMNRQGIGARIELLGGPVTQSQEMMLGGRYLSSDDTLRVFAAGSFAAADGLRLRVEWRSGRNSVVSNVVANGVYEIHEDNGVMSPTIGQSPAPTAAASPIRFSDASSMLKHRHEDQEYNDLARQPMLSHSLSHRGPGVAWADLDGDGWEECVVGTGRGGNLAVLRNLAGRTFQTVTASNAPLSLWDQSGLVTWINSRGRPEILAGLMNYEDASAPGGAAVSLDGRGVPGRPVVPSWEASAGPLAMADVDGDGDLDLFVGGRVIPGRYPQAASSRLYRNSGDEWVQDERAARAFQDMGLVSGAVFTDLNSDGYPELVMACEWGPVRVFGDWTNGPVELTGTLKLETYTGWWNGVTAGDFDNDGRMDLVASNWGRNTRFATLMPPDLEIYFGDWQGRGTLSLLEACFVGELNAMAPWRDWELVSREMPWIRERFNSYRSFGRASVADLLGERASSAGRWSASTLESRVFLNRGSFEGRSLPVEAQFAPAFAVCSADFDADGFEDVFLSQNFFGVTLETSRYDGGRGLVLRGDGNGGFRAVDCGVSIYGEQRGAAVCDFDHDGRADLVVTQNRGSTILMRNQSERRGVRVKLAGPPGNPHGVGAMLRAGNASGLGGAREIQCGSGYWSQNAFTVVLTSAGTLSRVQVRWPGGPIREYPIPAGTQEVTLHHNSP